MSKVIIILTSYNHDKFIAQSIESVLNQTFTDFQLIIWDDASTDRSWEIIKSFSDDRIKTFRNHKNIGKIINHALISNVVKGEFVAVHHSDDIWHPKKLEKQVELLNQNRELGAVFTWVQFIDENGNLIENDWFNRNFTNSDEILNCLFKAENPLCHPSILIRRTCYDLLGLYHPFLIQIPDADMWSRLILKYPIQIIPEKLTFHRQSSDFSNSSAPRIDVFIRQAKEWKILRHNFLEIETFERLESIFPSVSKWKGTNGYNLKFLLAQMCIKECGDRAAWLLGIDWLFELLNNPIDKDQIEKLYGFTFKDFIKISGEIDTFGFIDQKKWEEDALNFKEKICTLNTEISKFEVELLKKDEVIKEINSKVKDLENFQLILQARIDSVSEELNNISNSLSWKITMPFRVFLRYFQTGYFDINKQIGFIDIFVLMGAKIPLPKKTKSFFNRIYTSFLLGRPKLKIVKHRENNQIKLPALDIMHPLACGLEPGLVSIVLPVYNQANLISESIESVLAQTYQNFELIIINDGSTDGIEDILSFYLKHPKIRCYNQVNQKLPKALSNGFSFACGEYWTWTSADNIMEPLMLEKLISKLNDDPDLAMVYSDYYAIDDRGEILKDLNWRPHNRPIPASGEIRLSRDTKSLNIIKDNFIGPSFMYRGWVGKVIGEYAPNLGVEDYDYWMRINSLFKIEHLGTDDLLYKYRVHDNTLSANANTLKIFDKAEELISFDAQRRAFFNKTLKVWTTSSIFKYFKSIDKNSISHFIWTGEETFPSENIDLILIDTHDAIKSINFLNKLDIPTGIIINLDEPLIFKLESLLTKSSIIILTPDFKSAYRVKVMSNALLLDLNSNQCWSTLKSFAINYIYFKQSFSPRELERFPPSRIIDPNGTLIILQVDSFTQGGMENVVIDLGVSLKSVGFEVTIVNFGASGDMVEKAKLKGISVEEISFQITENAYVNWLKSRDVKLVNGHYSIFGAKECYEAGIPFIETIHNSYVWFDSKSILEYQNKDPFIRSYICVSKTVANYVDQVLNLDIKKIKVVPNGINLSNISQKFSNLTRKELRSKWKASKTDPVFLNVASLMATKGQLPLVESFAKIINEFPGAKLVLLGSIMEPTYFNQIKETVTKLKLEDCVIFEGYHREVSPYYQAADIFILPSFWEGWSLSLGEAIVSNMPCITTNVGSAYQFSKHPRVKIISHSFGDTTALNIRNFGQYVYADNSEFKMQLSKAMIEIIKEIRIDARELDLEMAQKISCEIAYKKYAEIFGDCIKNNF